MLRSTDRSLPFVFLALPPVALPLVALHLVARPAAAQSQKAPSIVLPAAAATADGSSFDSRLFGDIASRSQFLIAHAKLDALATAPIRRISVRRDAASEGVPAIRWKGGTIHLEVRASWTSADPSHPSPSFAANHGPKVASLYSGDFLVPDAPKLPPNTSPAPFDKRYSPQILLQNAFVQESAPGKRRQGNLCLEIVCSPSTRSGAAAPASWLTDAQRVDRSGSVVTKGASCWSKTHNDPNAAWVSDDHLSVGATASLLTSGPRVPLALLMVGLSDTTYGSIPLPLRLDAIGAKGCALYTSSDFVFPALMRHLSYTDPVTKTTTWVASEASFDYLVPVSASLPGLTTYSQWLFLDPAANALGITTTNYVAAKLAGPAQPFGFATVQAADPKAATGTVYVDRAPVLMLSN